MTANLSAVSRSPRTCGGFAFWLWTLIPCPLSPVWRKIRQTLPLFLRPCGLPDYQDHRMVFVRFARRRQLTGDGASREELREAHAVIDLPIRGQGTSLRQSSIPHRLVLFLLRSNVSRPYRTKPMRNLDST